MNEETRWMLNFLLHDLPFSQQLKLLEKSKKWAEMFERNKTGDGFHGVRMLNTIREFQREMLEYQPRMLLGRVVNGAQRDHEKIVHAVAEFGALCGVKPGGRRSVGWSEPENAVTCPKCLKRIEELEKLKGML